MKRASLGNISLSGESEAKKTCKEMVKGQPEQYANEDRVVSGAGSVRVLWAASNRIAA